jgi:hypothetical protein
VFADFIKNELRNEISLKSIHDKASDIEDPVDIDSDISTLKTNKGLEVLCTYHSAIIYSQLYNVTTSRKTATLYTLSEISQFSRHTNSFVCYHDQGKYFHDHIFKTYLTLI